MVDTVIPAKAGIQCLLYECISAFEGMTRVVRKLLPILVIINKLRDKSR
jgi:hypothetical protein